MKTNGEEKREQVSGASETGTVKKEKGIGLIPKLLCVFTAFIMWLYVAGDQTYEITFENVPVTMDGEESIVEAGLEAMTNREAVTTVTVRGKRSQLNALTAEDLSPHVSLRGITSSQLYMLPIKLNTPQGVSTVSISPESLSVYIDKMKLETIPLTAEIVSGGVKDTSVNNISVKLDVNEVTVEGPAEIVSNIAGAVVDLDLGGVITASADVSGEVHLIDASGVEIVNDYLSVTPSSVNAHIPVYTSKAVRVFPDFSGVDSEGYTCEIEPQLVTIKSEDADLLAGIDRVMTTPINLVSGSGGTSMYELVIPEGIILDSDDDRVEVKISNNTGKTLTLKNIVFVNTAANLKVSDNDKPESLEVRFVGSTEVLASLKESDYYVLVDLEDYAAPGKYEVPAKVVPISGGTEVDVDGEYAVSVTLEKSE